MNHGRKPDEQRRALALFLEEFRAAKPGDRLVANRASRFEVAVRASTARVHHPLGDAFAIEMRDLFQEVVVLENRRTSVADGAIILVVVDGMALSGSQIRARDQRPPISSVDTPVDRLFVRHMLRLLSIRLDSAWLSSS